LSNLLDKEYLLLPSHCCTPLTKTLLKTLEEKYYDIWNNNRKTRFRSNNDIPPIGFCINYNNPLNNKYSNNINYFYYSENINNFSKNYNNKKLVCVNNLTTEDEYKKLKTIFLNNILT
jgi:hypothetical protein